MADVNHVNPNADGSALKAVYDRGPTVAADGGRRDARDEEAAERRSTEGDEAPGRTSMKEVDHTPPHGDGSDVDRVFERGGTEEPVESEE